MASILDPLVDKQGGVKKSANWYRTNVQSLADRFTARKLMEVIREFASPTVC